MENCVLCKPRIEYASEIMAFRDEFLKIGDSMDGTCNLPNIETPTEWIEFVRIIESEETLPNKQWVTANQFIYVRESDQKVVGMIQFRHYLNDFLKEYGGHIGYSVRPSERRKGYAKQMLKSCLKVCKEYGLDKILITCIRENEGSRKTILSNGGVYENTVFCERDNVFLERYWITL